MAKLTFQVGEITAEYEFPKDDPVMDFVHGFNRRFGTPGAADEKQIAECLYWFASQLYGAAKREFIEQEQQKAVTEAENKYEFRRPESRIDTDAAESGHLAGATGGGAESDAPGTGAGGSGAAPD